MLLNENNKPILQKLIELDITVASGTNWYSTGNKYFVNGVDKSNFRFNCWQYL